VTEAADASPRGWGALPIWARVGVLALVAALVALVAIVAFRVATRVPPIPFGTTAVADLRPGSCLAEAEPDLAEYTVIPCGQPHPQQVFAAPDLELDDSVYNLVDTALQEFGDEVCRRYLEYRLFLLDGLETGDYAAFAIAVPDSDAYTAGDTDALCVIVPEDGGTITGDTYRPLP
jgi:hypothetical protein